MSASATHTKACALAKGMLHDWEAVFQVLAHPQLPPTNNEAERALRHWVILRNSCHGTRTEDGTRILAILHASLKPAVSANSPLGLCGGGDSSKAGGVFCAGTSFS